MDYIFAFLLTLIILLFIILIYVDRKECKEVRELKKELEVRLGINRNTLI